MGITKTPPVVPCATCGYVIALSAWQAYVWRKSGRAYCSQQCSDTGRAAQLSATAGCRSESGRAALSRRMTEHNPMSDPETRARQSATLRAIGHRPPVQGGNGRGLTEPQRLLSEALGWPTEVIVPTGQRGRGLPTHFKLDIANPELMIAVEIDGGSHNSLVVRERDQRKDAFLTGAGWTVLRFSNREAMADTAACVRTVMSITLRSPVPTPTA